MGDCDRRLLVNLLDVVGTFGPQEQLSIGKLAALYLGHLEKMASLVPEDKLTRISENAARQQGIRSTAEIEYAVLEADGRISFFTRDLEDQGSPEPPQAG